MTLQGGLLVTTLHDTALLFELIKCQARFDLRSYPCGVQTWYKSK